MTKREIIIHYINGKKIRHVNWVEDVYAQYDEVLNMGNRTKCNKLGDVFHLIIDNLDETGWHLFDNLEFLTPYEIIEKLNNTSGIWTLRKAIDNTWIFIEQRQVAEREYLLEEINNQFDWNVQIKGE